MLLQQTIGRLLPFAMRSAADIDSDIRDEFEFHLAMRTEENLRSGMSPAEAARDAHERFGDFEHSRRVCRDIGLGHRRWVRFVQPAMLALLVGVIVYQANAAVELRASSAAKIEALSRAIQRLQSDDAAPPVKPHDDSLPQGWSHSPALTQPWSDWSRLDLPATKAKIP